MLNLAQLLIGKVIQLMVLTTDRVCGKNEKNMAKNELTKICNEPRTATGMDGTLPH